MTMTELFGVSPEDRLKQALAALEAGYRRSRKLVNAINTPGDRDQFEPALEAIGFVLALNVETLSDKLAGDLASLRQMLANIEPPYARDDGEAPDRLEQAFSSIGLLSMALDKASGAALEAGFAVSSPALPATVAASIPRAAAEGRLWAIEKRLDEISGLLRDRIEPEGEPRQDHSPIQISLANFFVKEMKVEASIAKAVLQSKDIINIEALARAVENIAGLTRDFLHTLQGLAELVTQSLKDSAKRLKQPVRKVVSGLRGVMRRVLRPGPPSSVDKFREPAMVVVPAGTFLMGSPEDEGGRTNSEGPQHLVTIARAFEVGKYAVTVDEFAAFVAETKRDMGKTAWTLEEGDWKERSDRSWRNPGFQQTGSHPVVCVSWDDAQAYARWLSEKTGKKNRLLSEAEWEYCARGGMPRPYWWGSSISPTQANYGQNNKGTVPVDSYAPNPFGLYNVHGNVWEWVEDCWKENYKSGAPGDGTAWTTGDCNRRILRGGSWYSNPRNLRAANRTRINPDSRSSSTGFRLARTLNP
jgi:formylglycine-generating enzyme required for sulfatase activity